MKNILLSILIGAAALPGFAQEKKAYSLLQNQVDAFNSQDINKLVSNVTDDFKWYYIGPDTLLLEIEGKAHFKKSMESYFGYMNQVNTEITEFTVDNNRISFKEVVQYETASGKKGEATAMGIYEMKDGRIYRAWYFL